MIASGLLFFFGGFFSAYVEARDGQWTEWGVWSSCSETCGLAWKSRIRFCIPPTPGGRFCEGSPRENSRCVELDECPVDGGWSNWSFWTPCSKTCGRGVRRRFRSCTEPEPEAGGKPCEGASEQRQTCRDQLNCPRNGQWSAWSKWSACSVTCGEGRTQRFRSCTNPPPSDGGQPCMGFGNEINSCNAPIECPVNGQWSGWSEWTPCPVTCNTGLIERFRACNDPEPMFGGLDCAGDAIQTDICDPGIPCPVHGQWSQWSMWGPCLTSNCLTKKEPLSYRYRSCTNPLPAHLGTMCQGDFLSAGLCANPVNCPIDGKWSEWSAWECTAAVAKRTRRCDNPPPTNGGKPCPDLASMEFYSREDQEDMYREVCGNPPDDDDEDAQIGGSGQGAG